MTEEEYYTYIEEQCKENEKNGIKVCYVPCDVYVGTTPEDTKKYYTPKILKNELHKISSKSL